MPFTTDDFLDVFRRYNESVWPAQWLLVILALAAAILPLRARGLTRAPALILAVLWLWMGVVYQLVFFRSINPAATLFGALFIVQAGMFVWLAVRKPVTGFIVREDTTSLMGGLMISMALIVYPSLGWLLGHRYPASPTFGLPCPTTIFTFGLLLWTQPVLPRRVLIIPVLWSLVGMSAALQLGMAEDFTLPIVAVVTTVFALRGRRGVGRLSHA